MEGEIYVWIYLIYHSLPSTIPSISSGQAPGRTEESKFLF